MNNIKIWGWEKKKRTMRRFIKTGDIFCFQHEANLFCFGRIISRLPDYFFAEIFDHTSNTPEISPETILGAKRMFPPVNLDAYTLFDKKRGYKGAEINEWRIIGHQENFVPDDADSGIFFVYGLPQKIKKDIFGNDTAISNEEAEGLPTLFWHHEEHMEKLVQEFFYKNGGTPQ